ncbi:nucleotide-diphospho-sugar transferase [Penicillium chermesinum]|uniref:Nucleotide-diphospho-sugar transferase n=1 Tax=Penicillium chermesinum TaxID=63820 RepID=A0A9W9TY49_9EURO|nr:nucleotide-diphospho-sugar transferase [Penicillium chermesinum]KAJ5247627.1 nucleotide-diphospho-sugar transferase [Penicillium chermesinum]KAJ6151399.1 nucleotide-diphospho-sugar transferase [Penicillium chermesinum]
MSVVPPKALRSILVLVTAIVVLLTLFCYRPYSSSVSTLRGVVPEARIGDVDWSRYAYTQYVTNTDYLCNSVMLFEALHRLGSKADRLMMYPEDFSVEDDNTSKESKLLRIAREKYNVKLKPIQVQSRLGVGATWAESYTKLLAFNQTQYDRVLSLDSDSTVLQPMDELFLLPSFPVAMPRAYWLYPDYQIFSSQLVLIQPSKTEFDRIMEAIKKASMDEYDMEILNKLYKDSALILPHRPYDLLTGEFRGDDHSAYLGTKLEKWDPYRILHEAKFLHFSDWPVPKPWDSDPRNMMEKKQPKCQYNPETKEEDDCRALNVWLEIYDDFRRRRKAICGTEDDAL